MTVEFYIKYLFIVQIKKISESKKNKSINGKYLVCYLNKKHKFHVANLELSEKSNKSGRDLTFRSFFLADPDECPSIAAIMVF